MRGGSNVTKSRQERRLVRAFEVSARSRVLVQMEVLRKDFKFIGKKYFWRTNALYIDMTGSFGMAGVDGELVYVQLSLDLEM
jgi:hypothetical protein